jgi:glutathione S-transferase
MSITTLREARLALTLYFHPLSSFCQKVLIALYENATPFTPHLVNLLDPVENAAFKAVWPIGKFPVLRDDARQNTVPETSIIIEYLDRHYPGATRLVPQDPELALAARAQDRLFDLHINTPVGKIVTDRLRPDGKHDPVGVGEARAQLETALGIVERDMADRPWAAGDAFTLADCAAAPALFYADILMPFAKAHPHAAAYLARLKTRPSIARVFKEAEPYLAMMPR